MWKTFITAAIASIVASCSQSGQAVPSPLEVVVVDQSDVLVNRLVYLKENWGLIVRTTKRFSNELVSETETPFHPQLAELAEILLKCSKQARAEGEVKLLPGGPLFVIRFKGWKENRYLLRNDELKVALRQAYALAATPIRADEILKKCSSPDIQNYWQSMTRHRKPPDPPPLTPPG